MRAREKTRQPTVQQSNGLGSGPPAGEAAHGLALPSGDRGWNPSSAGTPFFLEAKSSKNLSHGSFYYGIGVAQRPIPSIMV